MKFEIYCIKHLDSQVSKIFSKFLLLQTFQQIYISKYNLNVYFKIECNRSMRSCLGETAGHLKQSKIPQNRIWMTRKESIVSFQGRLLFIIKYVLISVKLWIVLSAAQSTTYSNYTTITILFTYSLCVFLYCFLK